MEQWRPASYHRTEIHVLKSRFITTINRTESSQHARLFIQSIRDEMPDASHHVYVFRIGFGNNINEGMSDDGEPSGTAGPPSLAVLRGSGLGDIVLVTTRYFGGIKLGTGGLVKAYTESVKYGLASLKIEQKIAQKHFFCIVGYTYYEHFKLLLNRLNAKITHEEFQTDVTLTFSLITKAMPDFYQAIDTIKHHLVLEEI